MRTSELVLPARTARFDTTQWSVVLSAGRDRSSQGAEALERLCRIYWPPLCGFVRRQGYSPEDAQDLTQKFFASLLARNDFESVDPCKGKFRTFLLSALRHFLCNERAWAQAAKRGGNQQAVPLHLLDTEPEALTQSPLETSPDKLFDLRWAQSILQEALQRLQAETAAANKGRWFAELRPYLTEEPEAGDYAAAGGRLSMTTQAVAVAVHRLRQRFRELVREEVAQTVASPLDVEAEMKHLYQALLEG